MSTLQVANVNLESTGNTRIQYTTPNTMLFYTAGTERMRIGPLGQLGIGGANYGTSGQVLTSAGTSAAPSWNTPGFEQTFLLMGA